MKRYSIPAAAALVLTAVTTPAQALQVPGPLVGTEWLTEHLGQVVVLDARKDTQSFIRQGGGGKVAGVQACGATSGGGGVTGHIPGAALVPWGEYAITQKGALHDQLPSREQFEALMRKSGVKQGSAVVIAHRGAKAAEVAFATRLYWTLKYFGHDNVALLDGGVAKWAAEKRKVEYGRSDPAAGDWRAAAERRELLATVDDVLQAGQTVDGLPTEYYLGLKLKKGVVAGAGHIAGAKSLPPGVQLKEDGKGSTAYTPEQIRKVAAAMGIDSSKPVITFCNTGHMASLAWFTLSELGGIPQVRLYDGSMEEWTQEPGRPVATFVVE